MCASAPEYKHQHVGVFTTPTLEELRGMVSGVAGGVGRKGAKRGGHERGEEKQQPQDGDSRKRGGEEQSQQDGDSRKKRRTGLGALTFRHEAHPVALLGL